MNGEMQFGNTLPHLHVFDVTLITHTCQQCKEIGTHEGRLNMLVFLLGKSER